MIAGRPVSGFHILTSLPKFEGIAFVPQAFEVGSARFLHDEFMPKIISNFTCNSRVYRAWKQWIEEYAPRTDSVSEYIQDHPYYQPLLHALTGESRDTTWGHSLPRSITTGLGFVWPDIIALCNPSVVTELTPVAPEPRTILNPDPADQALLQQFRASALVYYDHTLPALTNPALQAILKRRVDRFGRSLTSAGAKPQLIDRIKNYDENFISLQHRFLCAENLSFVVDLLSSASFSTINAEEEVSKLDGQVLKRRDLWSFRVGHSLSREVMDACMSLLRARDKQITEVYCEVNHSSRYFSPMKKNIFMSQKNVEIILQQGEWPSNDKSLGGDAVDTTQAVYLPVNLQGYWILIIVEVPQNRFLVFDVENLVSGEEISAMVSKISSTFKFCADWVWEYQVILRDNKQLDMNMSGVAVLSCMELFIHSVPFIVTDDLIDRIGKMFCYCLGKREDLPIQSE